MDTIFLFIILLLSLILCFKFKKNPDVDFIDHRYYKIIIFTAAILIAFIISILKRFG
jgi:hypothetical protein